MHDLKQDKFLMFRNAKFKKDNPDFKGIINLDGVIYGIVAWIKEDSKGNQFLSGTINDEIPPDEMDIERPKLKPGTEL